MEIREVYVIGAGTMGSGIAQVAAVAGYQTTIMDVVPEQLDKAKENIQRSIEKLVSKGQLSAEEAKHVDRIRYAKDMKSIGCADLVIEAVVEDPSVKQEVFRQADGLCPERTILASNTSSISITKIASSTRRPHKVIGMHFMNPVPLMRLVEVVRGLSTSEETTRTALEVCYRMGKEPIEVNDSPGFISNRILCPMINEAIFALQEGVGTPEAIDAVMKLGMNHPMGPLALADLIGLDVVLAVMETLHRDLGEDKYRPAYLLRKMVAAGHLGRKTGRGFYQYVS
ncbi:MAG: 3-hydroxybutyryl-CoA dehydrogenase [Anaerolineales bacterium]|nr:3-hydroxybutyryl-CoA dehydrogenase [Anaerolineales bacterium]MDW8447761.1 3-hydroxybutyryl-CoA dehydrogenase [Anaerolineales bacterium]